MAGAVPGNAAASDGALPAVTAAAVVPPADASSALQRQLADRTAQLEQLEFERAELLVKLEESEAQLAALTANLKQQQQQHHHPQQDEGSVLDGNSVRLRYTSYAAAE